MVIDMPEISTIRNLEKEMAAAVMLNDLERYTKAKAKLDFVYAKLRMEVLSHFKGE